MRTAPDTAHFRTPDDLAGHRSRRATSALPGAFPFTRGIQPDDVPRPALDDAAVRRLRARRPSRTAATATCSSQGVNGLSVAFDLPTQIGYDSDHPLAAGEVGKVGVAIDSIEDMAALFDGIPLDRVSTSMTINATAIILLALYVAVARRQGVAAQRAVGTVQNDILKEYVARGTYIYPPRPSLRIVTDIIAFCEREHAAVEHDLDQRLSHPRGRLDGRAGGGVHAGARASPTCRRRIDAGLDVNAFGQRLSFFFNAHNDFLEEIAKFRAARRLWARIMRDRFGATNPRAQQLRFHAQTAGSTLTAQQPDNNIVRVALQALAAVLGGTQSLHCNGRDEALALPTEESATIALRTQQILLHESGVANTVDPVGGVVRDRGADRPRSSASATALLDRIDAMGGTLAAIETGFIQRADPGVGLSRAAGDRRRRGGRRRREPVHRRTQAAARSAERVPRRPGDRAAADRARARACAPAAASTDVARGARRRRARPRAAATTWCRRSSPPSRQRATLGEIADTLRRVFGEYQDVSAYRLMAAPLLDVQRPDRRSSTASRIGRSTAVDDVSFQIAPGETLGLVGESGSGKSVTAFSILRLLQPPGPRHRRPRPVRRARPARRSASARCAQVRGARISLIFQEPMTALNPVMRVGDQIAEALTVHGTGDGAEARARAVELLEAVRIPDAGAARARLSAPALRRHAAARDDRDRARLPAAARSSPTSRRRRSTSRSRRRCSTCCASCKARFNLALLLITHDFGVIAEMADRVAVMYKGQLVEAGPGAADPARARARVHPQPAGRGAGHAVDARQVRRAPLMAAARGPPSGQALRPQAGAVRARRRSSRRWTTSASRSTKARCSAWSANRAAARARPAAASCG